mmetsp:Transcript_4349/g.9651  ORF Transcript_4349/g.9651 Transcript_4349/m.9651 type:complete len:260 (-) Transcript_4349:1004-1783(-)
MVAATSGRNHMSRLSASSPTGTHRTPAARSATESRLGSSAERQSQARDCGFMPVEDVDTHRRWAMAAMRARVSASGTSPAEEMRPAKHTAAPVTPGTRSVRLGRPATRPRARSPGLCPWLYMRSHRRAWSCSDESCRWWCSMSTRFDSRIENAWARNSQAMRIWYETKRGVLLWHTTRPQRCSRTATARPMEAQTPMLQRYSRWQTCDLRSVESDRSMPRASRPPSHTMSAASALASTMTRTWLARKRSRILWGTSVAG